MSRRNSKSDQLIKVVLVLYTTLTAFLLIVFFATAPFVGLKITPSEGIGVVEVVLPLFTGYLGLILGHYFGTKEGEE